MTFIFFKPNMASTRAFIRTLAITGALVPISVIGTGEARADVAAKASRIYQRIAGVPLPLDSPDRAAMESKIAAGDLIGAAKVATAKDSFCDVTLKHMAQPMSNRDENALTTPLNDFIVTFIGTICNDEDVRKLLTRNDIYRGKAGLVTKENDRQVYASNDHYNALLSARIPIISSNLMTVRQKIFTTTDIIDEGQTEVKVPPVDHPDPAGLLTTHGFMQAHAVAGTNRRLTEFAFREFMCTPITGWADVTFETDRIRRDVTRSPGGDPSRFLSNCRGCHGGMDALSGAWAYYDYATNGNVNGTEFVHYTGVAGGVSTPVVQDKMNRNSQAYPDGYVTRNNQFENYVVRNSNAAFGWSSSVPLSGYGAADFGRMLSESKGFASCMVLRAFREICRREPAPVELPVLNQYRDDLVNPAKDNYNLKRTFEKIAVNPACLGE